MTYTTESRARDALRARLKDNLDSLAVSRIGDLSDDDVRKLQIRLDVLEKWASLNDSAIRELMHDDDTNLHHHHTIEDVVSPAVNEQP
ncbi:hypothetical protein [Nocardia sp. NPDC004750]